MTTQQPEPGQQPAPGLHHARTRDLDAVTLYGILRVRQDVFVVEQDCVYTDIDGRDLEPDTVQWWAGEDRVDATLRLLRDEGGIDRIGRVATAPHARGSGLASALMRAALEHSTASRLVLDAQSYLIDWYAGFGFVPSGPEFVEDDILHTPMALDR